MHPSSDIKGSRLPLASAERDTEKRFLDVKGRPRVYSSILGELVTTNVLKITDK